MNVVDSSAWLAYFADEANATEFSDAIEDWELLLVPSIVLYEVFRVVLRERGENEAFQVVSAMQQGHVIDLDMELSLEAAALGQKEQLAMADSIIYATAVKHEATLWTQDDHFEGKLGVEFRRKK
jgi:predicted nucleic acid-binding protein